MALTDASEVLLGYQPKDRIVRIFRPHIDENGRLVTRSEVVATAPPKPGCYRKGRRPLPYCERCHEIVLDDTHACATSARLPNPANIETR